MDITKLENNKLTAKQKTHVFIYDIVSILATAVVAIAILFTFAFRIVGVDGTSMLPTLNDGDWLIVSAYDANPQYGQVIIITQPNELNKSLVKRIIATEGQTVDIDFDNGVVYVDGNELNEPYIYERTHDSEGVIFPVTVPKGCVFVMGDNRNNSTDSRSEIVGFIDENYILGQAKYKIITNESGEPKFNSPFNWKIN